MSIKFINGKPYNNGDGMSNFEIIDMANKLNLPNFKYYMRDQIPKICKNNLECGIINLDSIKNKGTHHCCYWKNGDDEIYYFDSFGNSAPRELVKYLKHRPLCSSYAIQQFNDSNCSEWCLYVLNKLNKGENFIDIILDIVNDKR